MKLITLIFTLISAPAAWSYPCPQEASDVLRHELFQAWLGVVQGRSSVGDCDVEITVCDPTQAPGPSAVLGEIYILERKSGREAYLPLTLRDGRAGESKTSTKMSDGRLSYIKYDYLPEGEFGRTEAYRLDLRLNKESGKIQKVDLGTYSTNKKLNRPDGNRSRWYNCTAASDKG